MTKLQEGKQLVSKPTHNFYAEHRSANGENESDSKRASKTGIFFGLRDQVYFTALPVIRNDLLKITVNS